MGKNNFCSGGGQVVVDCICRPSLVVNVPGNKLDKTVIPHAFLANPIGPALNKL